MIPIYLVGALAFALAMRAQSRRWHVVHVLVGLAWPLVLALAAIGTVLWMLEDL